MTIFIKSFQKLMKWNFTIIYILIMSIVSVVLGVVLRTEVYSDQTSTLTQMNVTLGIYYVSVFMWVLGIPFLIIMTAKGVSLIANEIGDGTMGLLVSTKLSRFKIVFYNWLALYISMVLLGLLSIVQNITILYFISDMNVIILNQLILSIPNLLLYLLFIGFIFSTMSILMSLLIQSKVFASITMFTMIIFIFLVLPLFKTFLIGYYENYSLYMIDLNYHFSMVYYHLISSHVEITPSIQIIFNQFIGVFDLESITDPDIFVQTGNALYQKAPIRSYLSVRGLLYSWGIISLAALLGSMVILEKHDIN